MDLFTSRIRLRHIHCFVSVAQERNLGRAAGKLRLSQPAISKTLSELEAIVGVKLFERGRLGAQLTTYGEAFLTHALPVLEALDAAGKAVSANQAPKLEAVHIGALPTVGPDLLPPALARFRAAHPQTRVVLHTATNAPLLDQLKAGELAFVLGRMAEPQMMMGLAFELLYVEPLALVARTGHPLAAASSVSLHDVVGFPLVVPAKGTIPRHNTESYLHSWGLTLPPNCTETQSVSIARLITRQSDSIWFTPVGAVRDDLDHQALVQLAISTKGTEEPVGLLHRSDTNLDLPVLDFMKIVREAALARRG